MHIKLKKEVAKYVLIAFLFSWGTWIAMALLLPPEKAHLPRPWHLVGVAGPMVAALFLTFRKLGRKGVAKALSPLIPHKDDLFWSSVGFLTPFVLGAISLEVFVRLTGGRLSIPTANAFLALFLTNIILSPLEELGWRGYVLPRIQSGYSALRASLVLGVIWGLWHAPFLAIRFYDQIHAVGFLELQGAVLIETVLLSIFMTWLYNGSRGSLFPVCLFHANFDTVLSSVTGMHPNPNSIALFAGPVLGIIAIVVIIVRFGPANLATGPKVTTPPEVNTP